MGNVTLPSSAAGAEVLGHWLMLVVYAGLSKEVTTGFATHHDVVSL
jgi:hypothetical protein